MKLLLILPRPLFPPDTGGKIRTLNIFARLAKRMDIHAISLADKERDAAANAEMKRVFRAYEPVFWKEKPRFSTSFYAEFIKSRFSRFPYFLAKYQLAEFRRAVDSAWARERFDLLVCDFLQSAAVVLGTAMRPRVVFEHNVEYQVRLRQWKAETDPLRKWLLRAEWEKAREIEAEVCRTFDRVVTVSAEDRQTIMSEFGVSHVAALPTGVDVDSFHPLEIEPRRGNLVFVGSMDWYPNEDGVLWFVRHVYPRIRRSAPQASLTVVGRNPSDRVRALCSEDPSIEVTGRVDDVRPFLARAEVVVVPLRIGGGTRIKIFEAMAMGRPVVSTSLGAEGLPVAPGREILLEDEPESFAQAVANLLGDPGRRVALGQAARDKVKREHTWEVVADRMAEIFESVVSSASASDRGPGSVFARQGSAVSA